MAGRSDLGDGDMCPVDPSHQHMTVVQGSNPPRQWCRDQSHDGRPKSHPQGPSPATRSIWPLHGYDAAVAEWRGEPEARSA